MLTAIDTSVLIDIAGDMPGFADASAAALRRAASEGGLAVCEVVVPDLGVQGTRDFLADWKIEFLPSTFESALTAGEMFERYLARGGAAQRVVPDFIVGAHALIQADRLLTRDRGYLRDYFQALTLLEPVVAS